MSRKLDRFSSLNELQYVILPGKYVLDHHALLYEKLYVFWKKHWLPILKSLDPNLNDFSDVFTRQTELTGLFHKDEPIGFFCLDLFNINSDAHREHSYFKPYPSELMSFLRSEKINRIIVNNQLSVRREYRGGALAELLIGLSIRRFQETQIDYKLSYTRNSTKTNEMAYKWGWYPVLKEHHAHGESADFIMAKRGDVEKYLQHPLWEQVEKLWNNRVHESGFLNERTGNANVNIKEGLSTNVGGREQHSRESYQISLGRQKDL